MPGDSRLDNSYRTRSESERIQHVQKRMQGILDSAPRDSFRRYNCLVDFYDPPVNGISRQYRVLVSDANGDLVSPSLVGSSLDSLLEQFRSKYLAGKHV